MTGTLDPRAQERVDTLLATMDRAAKLNQLQVTFRMTPEENADLARAGIGALFWPMGAAAANAVQRVAVEESPHGIPLLIGLDVIHGHRTIFPVPLAQACSFDPSVTEADGRISAAEATSNGVNWAYSPMVDVSRDPRWGRICEGFGEDALLGSIFGAAKVRGFQGASLSEPTSLAACAKHYVGYGAAEGGRDYNGVDMSERRLRDVYLRPFKGVVEAGTGSVMASFNTIAGRPVHANRHLLTEILKEEWGFDGVIVGDADGVANLVPHGVARDHAEARQLAFGAGLDVEMGVELDLDELPDDLETMPDERLDDAVRRVLTLKVALGLFDNPYVDESAEILDPPGDHLDAAQDLATRCGVLLANDGTLPLAGPAKVILTGPYATSTDHLGAWVQHTGVPARSLAETLAESAPDLDLTVLPATSFLGDEPVDAAAVRAAAAGCDVAVVAVGEPSDLTGEASSRADLHLPGDQERLIHVLADAGIPVVVVLVTGRPLVMAPWLERVNAVLLAWHLGTRGAEAIADLLTGRANPAGRLAVSIPRATGQVPIHYDHENTGRPATTGGQITPRTFDIGLEGPANIAEHFTSKYRDLDLGPEFAFGDGLSYSTFAHAATALRAEAVTVDELASGRTVQVSTRVTNTSERDGDEVLLVFVHDLVASLAQPVRRLAAFRRVHVPAGESVEAELEFGFDQLAFWVDDGAGFRVEPGDFEVLVGPRPDDLTRLQLTIKEDLT